MDSVQSYQGKFEHEDKDNILAKIYLLVYLEILPILEQEYQTDVDDDVWGKDVYIDFLNDIAENVTDKIQKKISSLDE